MIKYNLEKLIKVYTTNHSPCTRVHYRPLIKKGFLRKEEKQGFYSHLHGFMGVDGFISEKCPNDLVFLNGVVCYKPTAVLLFESDIKFSRCFDTEKEAKDYLKEYIKSDNFIKL